MAFKAFAPVSVIVAPASIIAVRSPERPMVLIVLNKPPAPVRVK